MRIAWFSPLPPVRSGIAAYSAELLPQLAGAFTIDSYGELEAHDFVWKHLLAPYDLTVYQLGNSHWHDYMWAYLVRYPGLVVLHDARLHHARAAHLLGLGRLDDYRREFRFDHPSAPADAAEYAVEGLSGSIYYFWPMLRVPVATARLVAVHNARVAADLRDEYPGAAVDTIRMGVPADGGTLGDRERTRRSLQIPDDALVFAALGKVTAEKRIGAMLDALRQLCREGLNAWLMLVGDANDYGGLADDLAQRDLTGRVRITGYVPDDEIGTHLAAADVCLCLRWPTALETSASWLRCLAAGRATIVSDLAHLADVPAGAALRVDVLDETRTLVNAMRRLADDTRLRDEIAAEGLRYWAAHHTIEKMAADYRRVLAAAAARPAPAVADLPSHFTADYSDMARGIARQFDVAIDVLDG